MRRQPIAYLSKPLSLLLASARLSYSTTTSLLTDPTQLRDFHSSLSSCSETLKHSAKTGSLLQGKLAHARAIKLGICSALSLQNHILNVYVKCKNWEDGHQLFDEMRVRNSVAWNTVICGLVVHSDGDRYCTSACFDYFKRMLLGNSALDSITLNALFRACVELDVVETGRQLHCFVVKLGFELNCFVVCALVDLYGKFGLAKEARCAFDRVLNRDLVLWNVMLSCYALNRLPEEAFLVFSSMRGEDLSGDGFTFSSLLNSCGALESGELGRQIHGLIVKLSFDSDVLVASGIIDAYAKNGCMFDARRAFDGMSVRNLVSWNTMIVGYGQLGEGHEAMMLLREMLQDDVSPDELTISGTISSWDRASLSISEIAQIHGYVMRKGFEGFSSVRNSLIDAYSKNGRFASALLCFGSAVEPDLVTWTALIHACGFHNCPRYSVEMFEKMVSDGVRPDRIAFLGILSACSHAGLVNEGIHYFNLMVNQYQLIPGREHYSCLVDLLGRAGFLDDAFKVLTSIPFQHGSDTWGAFLGACSTHGNLRLAKSAAEMLFKLEPTDPASYALMSNMYASGGQWTDVARLRKLLKDKCDHKLPGCSWTEPS
ncbi:Pentatricopeptide repeat-containing protein At2g46050, mitochondrial [Linum perenne]